jgi:hypothetical protein
MNVRRAILGAVTLVAIAAACSTFGEPDDAPTDAGGPDGGGTEAAPGADATAVDAGGDATEAGEVCTVVIDDDFEKLETWQVYGSSPPSVDAGEVRIIDERKTQGGALIWPTPIAGRRFFVKATFRVGPKPPDAGIGDSLAFSWMPVGPGFAPANVGNDAYICAGSNVGNVVYVGTSSRKLRIGMLMAETCGPDTEGANLPVWNTNPHTVEFEVVDRAVQASFDAPLDAASVRVDATLPSGYSPFVFVVSAGSGGAHAAHYLQRIVVTACN